MKEVTRIFTVQIISIAKVESEDNMVSKEDAAAILKEDLEAQGIDDVVVNKVQDFIRDID